MCTVCLLLFHLHFCRIVLLNTEFLTGSIVGFPPPLLSLSINYSPLLSFMVSAILCIHCQSQDLYILCFPFSSAFFVLVFFSKINCLNWDLKMKMYFSACMISDQNCALKATRVLAEFYRTFPITIRDFQSVLAASYSKMLQLRLCLGSCFFDFIFLSFNCLLNCL